MFGNQGITSWPAGGDDFIRGEDGDDHFAGRAGNDRLWGDYGSNVLEGGTGDDFYLVSSLTDTVVEYADEGWDVVSGGSYPVGSYRSAVTGGR